MKKLQNNFTIHEQSKRLLELGVPADSADCYYGLYKDLNVRRLSQLESNFFYKGDGICDTFLPCWSVGRLIEIYEICVGERFERKADKSTLQLIPLKEDVLSQIEEHTKMMYRKIDFSKLEE